VLTQPARVKFTGASGWYTARHFFPACRKEKELSVGELRGYTITLFPPNPSPSLHIHCALHLSSTVFKQRMLANTVRPSCITQGWTESHRRGFPCWVVSHSLQCPFPLECLPCHCALIVASPAQDILIVLSVN
jgi:hypothetical protein